MPTMTLEQQAQAIAEAADRGDLVSAASAARQIGISRQYAGKLLKTGTLKGVQISGNWLVFASSIADYAQSNN